ncbi:hypothetical protein AGLY_008291 [Aphis glycines]|uniref:Uncharacterized protein n=1 Tax=Aphis glycines TaxID=307491 RepID=A0A6G0TLH1_APHGL|nr:hypothetical protein AGLY_008291 [Aphis glycines]
MKKLARLPKKKRLQKVRDIRGNQGNVASKYNLIRSMMKLKIAAVLIVVTMRTSCGKNTDSINCVWRTSCQLGPYYYISQIRKTVVIDHLVIELINQNYYIRKTINMAGVQNYIDIRDGPFYPNRYWLLLPKCNFVWSVVYSQKPSLLRTRNSSFPSKTNDLISGSHIICGVPFFHNVAIESPTHAI